MSCKVVTSSFSVSGASLASALAILSVKLSLRRLPTIVTMGCGAAMDEILCWNGTGCLALAAPAKRCKCMKLDFGRGLRKVFTRRRLPARERLRVYKGGIPGLPCGSATWRGDHLSKSRASPALVRIDQIFFTGGALAVDGDVRKLQRLPQ